MKIKQITLYHVCLPMKFNFVTAKSSLKERHTIIIKIKNLDGLSGYGEVVSFPDPFYTSETFDDSWQILHENWLPKLFKIELKHPFDIHTQFQERFPMAMAGLENALLDLYYKEKGENTISSLFDETLNPTIYRGAVIGEMSNEQMLEQISQLKAEGVKRIKLKISPKTGYERLKAAYQAHPDLKFAVDANKSYDLKDWKKIEQLNEFPLLSLEEPFNTNDLSDYQKIKPYIKNPICFDESIQNLSQLKQAIQFNIIDLLNIKVGRFGGLMQTKEMIEFCREHAVQFWIGSMVESGISKILHVQLAGLSDNYMAGDLSDSKHYFEEDLIAPEIIFTNGEMKMPNQNGLGVQINQSLIEKYTIKKKEFVDGKFN